MNPITCSACRSPNVHPGSSINTQHSPMYFGMRKPIFASVARVCLDCGHLMQFVPPEDLAKLRAAPR